MRALIRRHPWLTSALALAVGADRHGDAEFADLSRDELLAEPAPEDNDNEDADDSHDD